MGLAMQTNITALAEAQDLLYQTETMVRFVQSITLINGQQDFELSLDPDQVTGLYYVLKNIIENMQNVGETIQSAKLGSINHA